MSTRGLQQAQLNATAALAVRHQYEDELAKLKMQLVRYRTYMESQGLEPPDDESADLLRMWRNCEAVVRAAHVCLADLGTSRELLAERWR